MKKETVEALTQFEQNTQRSFVGEKLHREREALRLYEPLKYQQQFHKSRAQKVVIQKGNRTGGAQPPDEPVLTPGGWCPIGDLVVGDQVIGGDGQPCNVTGVYPQGVKELVRVTFNDGASTRCCVDHLWKCKFGNDDWQVLPVSALRENTLFIAAARGNRAAKIPMVASNGCRVLCSIEPIENGDCLCIAVDSPDHTYVTRDYIVTHNTLANMVEIARAVTGQDPHKKYPLTGGKAVVLGFGESHIGRVFHQMLFAPGAFRIIRDKVTKQWRTFRDWDPAESILGQLGDGDRPDEAKPSPPLIPKRFIDGRIAWVSRGDRVFSVARFTTGWELHAMNSAGDPGQAQGFHANLYAIDEDLATGGWYEEAVGRIAACKGLLRWSALPHAKNHDLMSLLELAEQQTDMPEPEAVVIRASILDNPYQDRKGMEQSIASWKSMGDDVYRKRVMGEIVMDQVLMYPTYNRRIHCAIRREGEQVSQVQKILMDRQGEPPNDWTRYMVVDPGHTVCAVLFFAVPPPELGSQKVCYQEAYIRNSNASNFGEALDLYARDKVFEKFIIDMHGANITSSGDGIRPLEYYTDELVKRSLKSEQTGMAFAAGCDRIGLREDALRNWLAIERDGQPTIIIVNERCPNLVREIEHFKKKTTRVGGHDIPLDEGNRRANTHAVECLEYAAADGLEYVKPRSHAIQPEWVDIQLARDARRNAERKAQGVTFGSNHINLGPQGAPVT